MYDLSPSGAAAAARNLANRADRADPDCIRNMRNSFMSSGQGKNHPDETAPRIPNPFPLKPSNAVTFVQSTRIPDAKIFENYLNPVMLVFIR